MPKLRSVLNLKSFSQKFLCLKINVQFTSEISMTVSSKSSTFSPLRALICFKLFSNSFSIPEKILCVCFFFLLFFFVCVLVVGGVGGEGVIKGLNFVTLTIGVSPPHSSGINPTDERSCMTRSGLAPSLSIYNEGVNEKPSEFLKNKWEINKLNNNTSLKIPCL